MQPCQLYGQGVSETPPFEPLDARFERLVNPSAELEGLANRCRWMEGPAYFPTGRHLVWSDVTNGRVVSDVRTASISRTRWGHASLPVSQSWLSADGPGRIRTSV